MSAQEFKVGDIIRNDDYDRLPVGAKVCLGLGFATFTKEADNLWRSDHGYEARDEIKRFSRNLIILPAEPEDKDDLYVEPEPLKEGVVSIDPDDYNQMATFRAIAQALDVLPGDRVEDWRNLFRRYAESLKPARCTSLVSSVDGSLRRCERGEHGNEMLHLVGGYGSWTDAEAYGRVEVSS